MYVQYSLYVGMRARPGGRGAESAQSIFSSGLLDDKPMGYEYSSLYGGTDLSRYETLSDIMTYRIRIVGFLRDFFFERVLSQRFGIRYK